MTKPDEQLLQRTINSQQAQEWLRQLIGVFYDRDARRNIRQAVASGLPALVPELGDNEIPQLVNGVFQELCRQASREATPPQHAQSLAAHVLSGAALEDFVVEHYPYPIAAAFQALSEQDNAAAGFGCLLDTFEAVIHYLGSVAVGAYLRTDLSSDDLNRLLLELLMKENWSTGDLFGLLIQTVARVGDCGGLLPYPLREHLFTTDGKPTSSHRVLDSFIELRNRHWGHGTGRSEASFQEILAPNRELLEAELARMPWLADWRLIRPVVIEDSVRIMSADLLNGSRRRGNRDFQLTLRAEDSADAGGDVRADRDALLLVSPNAEQYLPLFPLAIFQLRVGARGHGTYFLQRRRWKEDRNPLQLSRAYYVAYESGGAAQHEEGPREFVTGSLERHAQRLQDRLPTSERVKPESVPAAEDPDHSLPEVWAEQQSHVRSFVGREDTLRDVAAWIDGETTGGYLLLLAPPGQGKSAFMAELARREMARGGCLLHMVKSHRNPLRFIPALIGQVSRLTQTAFGAAAYQGDVDDLRNSWIKSLEVLRERCGRVVVVLDALDELETGFLRLQFLPPALPEGVRVVLTCRPDIPLVTALRARLSGAIQERTLEPLSEPDFRLFLERRLGPDVLTALERGADLSLLFRRVGGIPLFLQALVEDLKHASERIARGENVPLLDLDQLPDSLNAVFRGIYDRVRGRQAGEPVTAEGKTRALLLQLLSVAREPLNLLQLLDLLTAAGQPATLDDCRDRVDEISQWLLDVGGERFKPWHQGLTDYVRTDVLAEAGVLRIEGLFVSWLSGRAADAGLYGLRHRLSHLLTAAQHDAAGELLLDRDYLEAKVEAGLVFELVADFHQSLQSLPADHPSLHMLEVVAKAIQQHSHFLSSHPTSLFQCLWNVGWWYDASATQSRYEELYGPFKEAEPLPWNRPGLRLSAFLEQWKSSRLSHHRQSPWLRSLRPPSRSLDTPERAICPGHEDEVRCVAFSSDGRRLASGSDDRTIRIWDTRTGVELFRLAGHEGTVHDVAFTPDGRVLVSASADGTIRSWDMETGAPVLCLRGHKGAVLAACVSPCGLTLASGGTDRTIRLWDARSGRHRLQLSGHEDWVWCVRYAPDGTYLASASKDCTLRTWDAETGLQRHHFKGHTGAVWGLAISPDSGTLATAAQDESVRFWDATKGKKRDVVSFGRAITSIAYASDAVTVVGMLNNTAFAWSQAVRPDTQRRFALYLFGHSGDVLAVACSPTEPLAATASADRTIRLWTLDNRAERLGSYYLSLQEDGPVTSLSPSPDGQYVAVGTDGRWMTIYETSTGTVHRRIEHAVYPGRVEDLCFSPNGSLVAAACSAGFVGVWDMKSGVFRTSLHHRQVTHRDANDRRVRSPRGPCCVCFSPDSSALASGSVDAIVRVWKPETSSCLHQMRGHREPVTCLAYSADGTKVVSGSDDKTARIWATTDGAEVACLRGHQGAVTRVLFSPDGSRVVTRSLDDTIRSWDAADGCCLETFAATEDEEAIANGKPLSLWRAVALERETVVVRTDTGEAVAWWPSRLENIVRIPGRTALAGVNNNYVTLIELEN